MWKLYYFVNRSKWLPGGKLQGAVMWSAARHPKPRSCPPICKRTHCHSAALQVFTDSDTRKTGVVSTFFRLHLQPSYRHSLKKKTNRPCNILLTPDLVCKILSAEPPTPPLAVKMIEMQAAAISAPHSQQCWDANRHFGQQLEKDPQILSAWASSMLWQPHSENSEVLFYTNSPATKALLTTVLRGQKTPEPLSGSPEASCWEQKIHTQNWMAVHQNSSGRKARLGEDSVLPESSHRKSESLMYSGEV